MAESKFNVILGRRGTDGEDASRVLENKKRGRPTGKRSNPNYVQVTAYIPQALYTEVKIALLREGGGEFSDLVTELLSSWMQERTEKVEEVIDGR